MEPWRARPVPFCRHGLAPPPRTSARVLVDCVPARRAASWAVTTWCMSGTLASTPNQASSRSIALPALPAALVSLTEAIRTAPPWRRHGRARCRPWGRHGPADQEQVPVGVGLDHGEVEGGGLLAAGAAGHAGAAEDPGRRGAGPDGPGRPVDPVGAVAGAEAGEPVALHHAGEALALAHGGHVDQLALRQEVGADLLADLVAAHVVEAELDEADTGVDVGFGVLPGDGLGELRGLLRPEGDLQRAVSVALVRLDLDHAARAHAQDGDGDDPVVVVPHLRHADLLADDRSCGHGGYVFLCLLRALPPGRTVRHGKGWVSRERSARDSFPGGALL